MEITIRDVNNHAPAFDTDKYDASIAEDAAIGKYLYSILLVLYFGRVLPRNGILYLRREIHIPGKQL